jgi:transposase
MTKAWKKRYSMYRRHKSDYERLKLTGKTPKVALIVCMRKLMTILNTMVKKYTHWANNPI